MGLGADLDSSGTLWEFLPTFQKGQVQQADGALCSSPAQARFLFLLALECPNDIPDQLSVPKIRVVVAQLLALSCWGSSLCRVGTSDPQQGLLLQIHGVNPCGSTWQSPLPLLCSFPSCAHPKCENYSLSHSFLLWEMIQRGGADLLVEGIYTNRHAVFN